MILSKKLKIEKNKKFKLEEEMQQLKKCSKYYVLKIGEITKIKPDSKLEKKILMKRASEAQKHS